MLRRFLGIAGDIAGVIIVWAVLLAAITGVLYGVARLWILVMGRSAQLSAERIVQ